jgi:hypothetical protein
MKFYCFSRLLDRVEDQEYELLFGVRIDDGKRGNIKKDDWGNGWIYEADESFRSWCAIAYGFDLALISDQEFDLIQSQGVAFLSRERSTELRQSLSSQRNILEQMKLR